jgi:transposase
MSALIGDKGYDGDGFRAEIVDRGAKPVIPNKSNRVTLYSFSKRAYKGRNVIERCFCRLKDFRRVATRYDKLARNFLAAVHLAAIVVYVATLQRRRRIRSGRCRASRPPRNRPKAPSRA